MVMYRASPTDHPAGIAHRARGGISHMADPALQLDLLAQLTVILSTSIVRPSTSGVEAQVSRRWKKLEKTREKEEKTERYSEALKRRRAEETQKKTRK
ncbi:hypothetical protein OHA10_26010 [Kribbella sp. NBC_00662]|uniref:hypothetical protein n=1 Tax=Kribbella sp. NBC_00662 TaxID=2975969 RepID=UPI003247EDE8